MSKKPKKARRPNVPMYTGPVEAAPAATTGRGGGGIAEAPLSRSTRSEIIQADYGYVITDLRRIGLLAGGLIAILIVLSFFIR